MNETIVLKWISTAIPGPEARKHLRSKLLNGQIPPVPSRAQKSSAIHNPTMIIVNGLLGLLRMPKNSDSWFSLSHNFGHHMAQPLKDRRSNDCCTAWFTHSPEAASWVQKAVILGTTKTSLCKENRTSDRLCDLGVRNAVQFAVSLFLDEHERKNNLLRKTTRFPLNILRTTGERCCLCSLLQNLYLDRTPFRCNARIIPWK